MPSARSAQPRDLADRSDGETPGAGPSNQTKTQRIAKACDRCRKSKSKCEPASTEGDPCKSCATTGAECAYTAPVFRRGPPKGYIQALEHRLHQVESVLAAIMSSTDSRSQSIIDEIGQDELASYILETVGAGPFGRTGREKRAIDTSKDNFFASIVAEQPKVQSHRSRRQSRATRENVIESVITTDPQIQSTRPTLAWQDRLTARLMDAESGDIQSTSRSLTMSPRDVTADSFASEPPRTRRRLEGPTLARKRLQPVSSRQASTQSVEHEDLADCADAFGNLSIDENREVRYHGNAAGLQLLAQTERSDKRNAKGIWMFPMAKIWPGPGASTRVQVDHVRAVEQAIPMPPLEVQDHLIRVFFTYVNPAVPVLDQESFMLQYNAHKFGYRDPEEEERAQKEGDVRPERPQKLSKLLLLAVFAYAASHLDPLEKMTGDIEDPANEYAKRARLILDTVYHESRSSTVQALILLGIREFGIGSLEEGWLHMGMATRMALDLGLNRSPDKWMHNGRQLFTEKEKTIRKRIWWACCLADKFSALFLGRTIGIHEGDFSTPLLDVPADDMDKTWQPCPPDPLCGHFSLVPAAYVGYFRYLSSLYVITGEVLANIYRVSHATTVPSRALREQLYQRLLQWGLDLPDHLNYHPTSTRPCPAPHMLAMHIQYWASVLLVHRPFIPKGSDLARGGSPSLDPDPLAWESYDICQSAASQVASFAMLYHEKYDMRWAPPFLANCIQAAGVLNVVTLKYKPLDTQASVGLQKCINALAGMERTWTTALRVRHLIQNAEVHIDRTYTVPPSATANTSAPVAGPGETHQKRPAEVAFEHEAVYPPRGTASSGPSSGSMRWHYDRYAHSVVPGPSQIDTAEAGTGGGASSFVGYMPGYDSWWPVLEQQAEVAHPHPHHHAPLSGHPGVPVSAGEGIAAHGHERGHIPGSLPSQEFTFSTQQFSPDFLQAMRDPVIHFPSAFAHQY